MMRTVTVVRQYLAAAFLIAIGLIAYGCGDTGTVNPVVELASLTVSPGTLQPAFSGGTTQYRVDLTSDIESVRVTAQPAVSGDSVTINGQSTTSRTITLEPPGSTTVVNVVVSETDTNSRTYVIRLVRAGLTGNNSLQNLTVSPGTLAPTFDENLQSYTANVPNNVGSVTVTPTLSDPAATMTVDGQPTASGQSRTITLNGPGQSKTIPIIVTAQNGADKAYTVTVSRGVSNNNNLSGLTVSPGPLVPSFSAGEEDYRVNVASNVGTVTVTPRTQDATATVTVNGVATNSGTARTITLPGAGSNTFINIVVTPQSGPSKTYTVEVRRAALGGNNDLQSLTISPGPLVPAFDAETENYTVDVASGVGSVTVTPRLQATTATMTVEGLPTTSGQTRTITLRAAGLSTVIDIVVTAQNGSRKPYTITVDRAAPSPPSGNNNLSALTVTPPGSIGFSPSITRYTVNVDSTVTSVIVRATKADANAVMSDDVIAGAGTATGQATIQLGGQGTTTVVTILVTAPNSSQKPYRIDVVKAAPASNNNLSALSVTPGTLSPSFASGTTSYTVNVGSNVTSMTVTATLQDTAASMTINGQGTSSGAQSAPITLGEPGSSTDIPIVVIAPNGDRKSYTITVNKRPSAPDLIPEDDSCLLFEPPDPLDPNKCAAGSREDNITNVSAPRFRISQPGTPSLYVDGIKVDSTFDQGASTLKPTTVLDDGDHVITYTLTNAGGESPQSLSLEVEINTVAPGFP
jgi:hypothetical protein